MGANASAAAGDEAAAAAAGEAADEAGSSFDPASVSLGDQEDGAGGEARRGRKRLALLLGNAAYGGGEGQPKPLANPAADARALGAKLRRSCAFDAEVRCDVGTRAAMEEAVDAYCDLLARHTASGEGAVGFFFYAGHAVSVGGANYLLPAGMPPVRRAADVRVHAMPLAFLLNRLRLAGNGFNVVVLDSCRDSAGGAAAAGAGAGLAAVEGPPGLLIAYACGLGRTAADSPELRNSVYTTALLRHVDRPSVDVVRVFQLVAADVQRDTKGSQVPWMHVSLTEGARFTDVASVPTQNQDGTGTLFDDGVPDGCWGMLESLSARHRSVFFEERDRVVTIGRGDKCTLAVPDSAHISRVHCRITRGADGAPALLEDLSSNGTWVSRRLVGKGRRVPLRQGAVVMVQKPARAAKIPRIAFRFHDEGNVGLKGTFAGGTFATHGGAAAAALSGSSGDEDDGDEDDDDDDDDDDEKSGGGGGGGGVKRGRPGGDGGPAQAHKRQRSVQ